MTSKQIDNLGFFAQLKHRWSAPLNKFWKKVLKFCLWLGGIAVAILGADTTFGLQALGVAPIIFTICGYVLTACAALGLGAKLTKV